MKYKRVNGLNFAASAACGSACGASDAPAEPKPSACGSACGAPDAPKEEEAPASACGAADAPKSACGA